MEKRIILPKTYIENIDRPLIFLAGPIRDARDWQETAINYIISNNKDVIIANPRWDASDRLRDMALKGKIDGYFPRQRQWERHYLNVASSNGAVLFWLENAPGLTARLELGQLMTQYRYDSSTRFCVGADEHFSDIETIKYDLSVDAPGKIVYSTLEKTCQEAIKLAIQPLK